MTKQEKIKEAYGEYWELVKETVNENGWFDYNYEEHRKIADNIPLESYSQFSSSVVRPKSLQGIENNNGWTKIESEEQYDELINGEYEWYNINNGKYEKGDLRGYGIFTHYKIVPIIKPKLPSY